jgi:hypothetical protein
MGAGSAKLRFSMAVFEDLARLDMAANVLVDLGLDPMDLCCVARREAAPGDAAGHWVLVERTSQGLWFQRSNPRLSAPSRDSLARRAASLIAPMLETSGAAPSHRSPVYSVWRIMNAHPARGELLLIARLPTPSLQDQATRALLRYSREPVHAEEFFTPIEPG